MEIKFVKNQLYIALQKNFYINKFSDWFFHSIGTDINTFITYVNSLGYCNRHHRIDNQFEFYINERFHEEVINYLNSNYVMMSIENSE